VGSVVLLFGLVVVFWQPLLARVGRWLDSADPAVAADAAVILGGGGLERTRKAAQLHREGLVGRVAVTSPESRAPELLEPQYTRWVRVLVAEGVPEDAIDILVPSYSTFDDARHVRDYMADRGFARVLVVTDPYHTRRAGWIIRRMLGPEAGAVSVVASEPDWFDPSRWWRDERQLLWVLNEYVKFAYYVATYGPSGPLDGTPSSAHRRTF
jgi:uncharacterized SAM-binding protein YcdF (DUF218 family)